MERDLTSASAIGGFTDSRGEWRPGTPVSYAPIFVSPGLKSFMVWLFNYLFKWNLIYLGIVILSYYFLQPPLDEMKTFKISWVATLFFRNMALAWIIFGGWHFYLYILKARRSDAKYSPRWQSTNGSTFLWHNQVYDNIFWSCVSGVTIWTAYEVLTFWLYANNKLPYIDFNTHPIYFVLLFLLIPFWREFHFYLIHRLIHWKPLYKRIHYLHHYNINPGPWSGLAMHPVEHILYFSVVLIHYIVPSHPLHFLFNSQHTALTPAAGHSGFEGKLLNYLNFGSYFHYLHHRLFDCNYGESTIPLDKWFGSFEDGSLTPYEKQAAAGAYNKFVVTEIIDESPEVKSFYLTSSDKSILKENIPGQHLTFKLPFVDNMLCPNIRDDSNSRVKYTLRSYTISTISENNQYRISVKKIPGGKVSAALHSSLKTGDILEAKGPRGSFIHRKVRGKPTVFIAAGIGITPLLSMLKTVSKTIGDIYLILAVREKNLLCFREEIYQICKSNPYIRVHIFLSREAYFSGTGEPWEYHFKRIDIQSLKQVLPVKKNFSFYICAPEEMTKTLVNDITVWKGTNSKIHTETFGSAREIISKADNTEAMTVRFLQSDKMVEWDHDFRNILDFAESNGISLEAGCMIGECGACSLRLEEGSIEYNHATAAKPAKGHCLPCSCHPASDIIIDA
jgi:ferredoxin-NADP reductase/sterol desaturase/sphingolipid hydroxylase (fatty acid hydroxylase superfamily)